MKEGWERTVPPMQLDITQIHDMITPVFPREKVVAAERIGTGLSNTNYKIRLEGSAEPYVLRLFRKGLEIAEKELAIIQRVRQTGPSVKHTVIYCQRLKRRPCLFTRTIMA